MIERFHAVAVWNTWQGTDYSCPCLCDDDMGEWRYRSTHSKYRRKKRRRRIRCI
jgi:hypothetical protein